MELKTHTILLVERTGKDSVSIRAELEGAGYRVLTAEDAESAMAAADSPRRIELILLDTRSVDPAAFIEAAGKLLREEGLPLGYLCDPEGSGLPERPKLSGPGRTHLPPIGIVPTNAGPRLLRAFLDTAIANHEERALLNEKNAQLQLLMNNPVDMVFLHDTDGSILEVNQRAALETGYSRDELLSMSIEDLDVEYEKRVAGGALWKKIDVNQGYRFEARVRKKGGLMFPVEVVLSKGRIGGKTRIFALARDISERKEVEEALERERAFLTAVFDSIEEAIVICDANGRIARFNESARAVHGLREHPVPPEQWADYYDLYRRDGLTELPTEEIPLFRALNGEHVRNQQIVIRTAEGTARTFACSGERITDGEGATLGAVVAMYDITSVLEKEKELSRSLETKEALMRELNHRVKNNLGMVSALISLKESSGGDAQDLSDIRSQVEAIAKIHETLQEREDITHVDFRRYVEGILSTVFMGAPGNGVTVDNNIPPGEVSTRTAVPLGLIVNEIATNAEKHGFTEEEERRFTLHMDCDEESCSLTAENSGRPFPEEVNIEASDSLGLQLIQALVSQLHGTLELRRSPNPRYTITFPADQL